ncbi:carboxypeptidase-like regulatory domain-containing protein [Halomonas nitroreducens]|uniref:Carboxypeptidase regulatory-like domain-containing protein n=1 Tax=Halomonas nitroreducens TaxID=447425 RepID=A0A3S0HQQ5_9GAMM|nr:carboxypeptidase-like regulatory domain-containing protein [Halomonas nitroreducens]RTR00195.1 carboxypeptidase regulatory-like domain-containing protein [Halomonas nitroreducens]
MRYPILTALLGLILTGCQMLPPGGAPQREGPAEVIDIGESKGQTRGRVPRQVAFPAEEYAALEKVGSAALSGRLTLDTTSGKVVGAGETISVAPVTTYSAEAAEQALAGRAVEPADPRARAYTHTTRTDANGHFLLRGLPAGEFYVSGSLVDPASGKRRVVIHQVSLAPGQHRQVQLRR